MTDTEKKTLLFFTLILVAVFAAGFFVKDVYVHRDPSVEANVYITENVGGVTCELAAGNLITNIGENYTQSWLGLCGTANTTARNATQWISLSNDGSPAATWTELTTEINANNFTRALGTVTGWSNSGDAAFNVTYTFTATGTQQLQTAGLQWSGVAESNDNLFAAADFTQTTFNSGDTLSVTWVITIDAN